MKLRNKVLILALAVMASGYCGYSLLSTVEHITFDDSPSTYRDNKKIVIVHMSNDLAGGELHELHLYRDLLDKGYNVDLLIPKHSELAKECNKLRIPYHASGAYPIYPIRAIYRRILIQQIKNMCKGHSECMVQISKEGECWVGKQVAKDLPVKLLFTRHIPTPFKYEESVKGLDGVIAVSPQIGKYVKEMGAQNVCTVAPLYDKTKFSYFETTESRKDFFKREFNLELQDHPVVCMVASMTARKNHKLLFKALSKLKKPVEVILAGSGPEMQDIEEAAKELKVDKYVHFLGFTDKVAQIMYHSDINVLPSKTEGCPISLLEAAALGKVSITSSGHGGDATIIHDKTGLIFKNGDENDLLAQLTKLLDNPELGLEMGKNAREHLKKNLSAQSTVTKITEFMESVW